MSRNAGTRVMSRDLCKLATGALAPLQGHPGEEGDDNPLPALPRHNTHHRPGPSSHCDDAPFTHIGRPELAPARPSGRSRSSRVTSGGEGFPPPPTGDGLRLGHRLVQVPPQLRDGVGPDRLVRTPREPAAADSAGAAPAEKGYSHEPPHVGRSPRHPLAPSGQAGPLPRPGQPQPPCAPLRHAIPGITPVAGSGSIRTAGLLPHAQGASSGLEGALAEPVVPPLPGVRGAIAPALRPDLGGERLPRLSPRGARCHGGTPPSGQWARRRPRLLAHPSSLTQRRLHHQELRNAGA
jgi:hypothetical protein